MEPVTPRTTVFIFAVVLMGTESSKHQAPSTREAPNRKLQRSRRSWIDVWSLKILWSLELGAWRFFSRQLQPPAQIPLRAHDVAEFQQIFLHRFADDGVTIIAPQLHLARGRHDARFDLLRRFSSALRQAQAQFIQVGRHDENVAESVANDGIVEIADRRGALDVNVDEDIYAVAKVRDKGFPRRSVVTAVNVSVLEKFAGLDPRDEIFL